MCGSGSSNRVVHCRLCTDRLQYTSLRSTAEHASHRGDADNARGVVQFSSGQIASYFNSRTAAAGGGYDNSTDIRCERGKISVNSESRKNRVSVHDSSGVGWRAPDDWSDRYREGFVSEVVEFVDGILDKREFRITLAEVRMGLEIALALQESLEKGGAVWFDESGRRSHREGGVVD